LALRLGKRISEIESWPASELYGWIAFNSVSPIGDERADFHAAQIAHMVAASQGAKAPLSDFLPRWGDKSDAGPMTDDQIMATIQGLSKKNG
jgi:hypothetical protein